MNIKYTVKNTDTGKTMCCVLDRGEPIDSQLDRVFEIETGHGIGAFACEDRIELTDYYHGSVMATFAILSKEDTAAPISLKWTEI